MIAEIIFPLPFDKRYSYKVPAHMEGKICKGLRVIVPFGAMAEKMGYIVNLKDEDKEVCLKLKEISRVLDEKPIFDLDKISRVSNYISQKWFSSFSMSIWLFLENIPEKIEYIESSKQKNKAEVKDDSFSFLENKNNAFLDGNVDLKYLEKMALYCIERNRKILFLFPDTLSAAFFYNYFKTKFGEDIAFFHSKLSKKEKNRIFSALSSDRIKIIAGLKSSIFLPYPKDSIIFIFDEHSEMYKQFDQHPYYEVRELALKLSECFDYKVIFHSLVARIDSYYKMLNGKLDLIKCEDRPKISNYKIIDMKKSDFFISKDTLDSIKENLEKNKKSIIISNVKGMYLKTYCKICGYSKRCDNCGKFMRVYYEDEEKKYYYKCSYCSKKEIFEDKCPKCGANDLLKIKGFGTQKICLELKKMFPDKKIFKIDGDLLKKPVKSLQTITQEILNGDYDILIGTDILLHSLFYKDDLALISFLNFDLHKNDFETSEMNMAKIIYARGVLPPDSKLIIETYEIENHIFSYGFDYESFIKSELDSRKFLKYPPFCEVLNVEFSSKDIEILRKFVNDFSSRFSEERKKELKIIELIHNERILNIKKRKIFSYRFIFKLENDSAFYSYFQEIIIPKNIKYKINEEMLWI
jgi:primosomal protein N' (replication factor Y)